MRRTVSTPKLFMWKLKPFIYISSVMAWVGMESWEKEENWEQWEKSRLKDVSSLINKLFVIVLIFENSKTLQALNNMSLRKLPHPRQPTEVVSTWSHGCKYFLHIPRFSSCVASTWKFSRSNECSDRSEWGIPWTCLLGADLGPWGSKLELSSSP